MRSGPDASLSLFQIIFIITDGLLPALTDTTFQGPNHVPNPSSSQGNSSPPGEGLVYIKENNIASQTFWETCQNSPGGRHSQNHQTCEVYRVTQ